MRATGKDGAKSCRDMIASRRGMILNCVARLFETFNRSSNSTAKEDVLRGRYALTIRFTRGPSFDDDNFALEKERKKRKEQITSFEIAWILNFWFVIKNNVLMVNFRKFEFSSYFFRSLDRLDRRFLILCRRGQDLNIVIKYWEKKKKGRKEKRKEYSILLGFSFERKLRAQILILVAVRDFFYGRR